MTKSARSTILAHSLLAGALVLAILQVGLVMVSDGPQSALRQDDVKFRFETRATDAEKRETRVVPRPPSTRS